MERKTVGAFLSALRKANGMTQQEVADKLNVSNKTVSKWERDEGYPEIMMLPAIAELYSVSVDEILRGEKITNTSREERKDTKSDERIKYLIEKATVKFNNSSIVSVILGVVALILAYTIGDIIYDYNFLWIACVIILTLVAVSVAITFISFNTLLSCLGNRIVEKEYCKKAMKNSINHITVIFFLSIVAILGLLLTLFFHLPSGLFAALPATAVVGGIVAYLVRYVLCKKYDIPQSQLSDKQRMYRKKHIKNTSIILAIIILISVISPFVGTFIDSKSIYAFTFNDAVGYQYSSQEEAENEYYKLKNHITDNKPLYNLIDEGYLEDGTYTLCVEELGHSFIQDENGYRLDYTLALNTEDLEFKSEEEAEKFKYENILISDYPTPDSLQKNVTFDDKTLTVNWQYNTNYLNGALDILPVFILFAYIISIIIIVISVIVYFRKKKKID